MPQVRKSVSSYNIRLLMILSRHTLSHSLDTSFSASCLQFIKLSIQPSNVGIDPGSVTGDSPCGCVGLPTSRSIFEVSIGAFLIAANSLILKVVDVLDLGCRVSASQSNGFASRRQLL